MCTANFDEFLSNHQRIFAAFRRSNVKLNGKKCSSCATRLSFWVDGLRQGNEAERGLHQRHDGVGGAAIKGASSLVGRLVWLKGFIASKMNRRLALTVSVMLWRLSSNA